jgi:hypothetical protein
MKYTFLAVYTELPNSDDTLRLAQDCDDWEQLTFYSIDLDIMDKEKRDVLKIQLAKPLDEYWEGIIIPRMKAFFAEHIYEDKAKLISIKLLDEQGNIIKNY